MTWLKEVFGTEKPIIAMCHLHAMPGDPGYDRAGGMKAVVEAGRKDLHALQAGGVDAVMFSNEFSRPYLTHVEPVTAAAMARVVGELMSEIRVPLGVNLLWDARTTIDVAAAVGAKFVREVFSGAYASDFGVWDTSPGAVYRHKIAVGAEGVRLLYNIYPEGAVYIAQRSLTDIAKSTLFNTLPDAICVSGITAGSQTDENLLAEVKRAVPDVPLFANTGVKLETLSSQLAIADGAVVGTYFKKDGYTWNPVDVKRVEAFMAAVRRLPGR